MNFSLYLALYLAIGLAMAHLRYRQGMMLDDALFCGLFWPLELLRHCIDLLVGRLIRGDAG